MRTRTGGANLADDVMMVVSDDTKAAEVYDDGKLGPKGRRWAALWRAVYGARLGCYNRKRNNGKRGKQPGTYEAAKAGVLAAAEYAVATSGTAQQGADEVIPLGVPKSFLTSALGDRGEAFNNDALRRFKKLSEAKKTSANPFLARLIAKESTRKERLATPPAKRLENIRRVCYVGGVGESLPHPVSEERRGLTEIIG